MKKNKPNIFISLIFLLLFGMFYSCGNNNSKAIIAEQKIDYFSRIILIEPSNGNFTYITDQETQGFSPQWCNKKQNIAFISDKNKQNELWIYDTNTNNFKLVNTNNQNVLNFAWAPNSKEIAIEVEKTENESNILLYSLAEDSILPITRYDQKAKLGSWSPDSKWIIYNVENKIYKSNPRGVDEILLIDNGMNPLWSNNSEYIAFTIEDNNKITLKVYIIDKNKIIEIDNGTGNIKGFDWAYNGNKLLYISDIENNDEIYHYDIKTKKTTRLTNIRVDENNIVWSEKNKKILFTSEAHGKADIYVMDGNGSSQKIILNSPDDFTSLDW